MMIQKVKYYILSILLVFTSLGTAFEKVAVTSFQFLSVSPLSREMSMGGAFTALRNTTAPYFANPANIRESKGLSFYASQTDYFYDTKHFAAAATWKINTGMALSAGLLSADYGSMEVTDLAYQGFRDDGSFNPGLTGQMLSMGAYVVGAGFSQILTNKFSYGIIAKSISENFDVLQKETFGFDLGLLYDTKFKSIQIGAALKNFGPQVEFIEQNYPLPQTMSIGVSAYLLHGDEALFNSGGPHSLLFSADLIQPRDYDQQYNIGFEYAFREFLFLRSGYRINYDTEALTLGAGLSWKSFNVDYAYNTYGELLPSVHRFALSYSY